MPPAAATADLFASQPAARFCAEGEVRALSIDTLMRGLRRRILACSADAAAATTPSDLACVCSSPTSARTPPALAIERRAEDDEASARRATAAASMMASAGDGGVRGKGGGGAREEAPRAWAGGALERREEERRDAREVVRADAREAREGRRGLEEQAGLERVLCRGAGGGACARRCRARTSPATAAASARTLDRVDEHGDSARVRDRLHDGRGRALREQVDEAAHGRLDDLRLGRVRRERRDEEGHAARRDDRRLRGRVVRDVLERAAEELRDLRVPAVQRQALRGGGGRGSCRKAEVPRPPCCSPPPRACTRRGMPRD